MQLGSNLLRLLPMVDILSRIHAALDRIETSLHAHTPPQAVLDTELEPLMARHEQLRTTVSGIIADLDAMIQQEASR